MKKFFKFHDGEVTVKGIGFYECVNMDYYIETNDNELLSYFNSMMKGKKHINWLEFTNADNSISVSGKYMIKSIKGGSAKEIHLKITS